MSESRHTQVVVLGAGPGGYAAAFRAADLGLAVTLVDPEENPGGVCLYRGCIPSKAYLHVARVIREASEAAECGVAFAPPRVDIERLRAWKNGVVEQLTGGLAQLCKARGVEYLRGRGSFIDARHLHVEEVQPGRTELAFEHAIVATGSRPAVIPDLLPESPRVMSSTEALELRDVPERLLVIGGGYIGLEMATVYAAVGSRVTVVEMTPALLPGADRDLVRVLERSLEASCEQILVSTRVVGLREISGSSIEVSLESADGGGRKLVVDKVLVAVGRRPNTTGLGLDNTRAEIDERGFMRVDAGRRTSEPSIYAIGDVTGEPMLAHKATHEGLVAAGAIAGRAAAFDPRAIPAVVFTDPEIAWCGLTESGAKTAERPVKVARFSWQASGRAATLGRSDGMTKLVIDPDDERVLGVGIVGPGAGDLISEGVLAIEMAAVASDVGSTIHPHPTLSETVMEAADVFYGQSVHLYRRR